MKQINDWIMRLSIGKKLIFYSYLVIAPVLLLISALLFFRNYKSAMEDEENTCLQSVQGLSDNIEVLQQNMIEIGTYISINTEVGRILDYDDPMSLNQDTQLWIHNAPMQIIQDIMALNGQLKTIAIYPENGVNPYLHSMDLSVYIMDMEEVRKQDIYALTVEEKGKMLWQRVGKFKSDTYETNRTDKIVMYREIYDLSRKDKLGYLVIGSLAAKFDEVCQNGLRDEREEIIVMSDNGAELVRCGSVEEDLISGIMEQVLAGDISSEKQIVEAKNRDFLVYSCWNEETGTVVYKLVPKVGTEMLIDSLYGPLAMLLGVLAGLYPVMVFISNIVSKPLHSLCVAMEKFKEGDFEQKVEVITRDEVGEASECFNRMVDDIKNLIQKNYVMTLKERESELDVLQAQINPHFLYNTLDSLYWRVMETGNEEIAEDILTLSQLFRLVLSRGNSIVTVRNEGELLERYLHIQKMRFGKRLEYEMLINEAVLEEEIPKLILEPFVENAIVHGFEKVGEDFYLSITGEKTGCDMVFYIRDTGVGMSKEQLDAIWMEPDTKKYASQRIGKYAIKNVKERLEMTYHEDFELKITSEKGHGTTVMLRIPCGLKEIQRHEREIINCR